ncbi:MAG TPA: DUF2867 domain-containing protein [Chloroflexia bacterium]|nr:DUF2867 domain-containing protein [Chloroflexia bacterium]
MQLPECIRQYPEVVAQFQDANVIDLKSIRSEVPMRQFLAGMFSYQPKWVTFLYGVRSVFVRFLGVQQAGIPHQRQVMPRQVPMQSASNLSFFKVTQALEDRYWAAEVDDTHLKAALLVVADSSPDKKKQQYYVVTLVYYHKWTGPLYYNIIRPFHHLVVNGMLRSGSRSTLAVS